MKNKSYLSKLISAVFSDFDKKKYDPDWNPREELQNRGKSIEIKNKCDTVEPVNPKNHEEMKQEAFDFLEEAAKNGVWEKKFTGDYMSYTYTCLFKEKKLKCDFPSSLFWNMIKLPELKVDGARFPHEPRKTPVATFYFNEKKLDFLNWNEEEYLTDLVNGNRSERERKANEKRMRKTLIEFVS